MKEIRHFLCFRYGHLEALQVLLNEGECSPNVRNAKGCTPLHVAAKNGKVYVIELLLNHPEVDVVSIGCWW